MTANNRDLPQCWRSYPSADAEARFDWYRSAKDRLVLLFVFKENPAYKLINSFLYGLGSFFIISINCLLKLEAYWIHNR